MSETTDTTEWEEQIAAYLLDHPEFFERHLDVLQRLQLPHACGPALSLLERQARVLREQNQQLRGRLQELVQVARENDCLAERMQNLNLVLIEAQRLDELMLGIQGVLRDEFNADFTAFKLSLAVPQAGLSERDRLSAAALEACRDVLHRRQPWCGRPTSQQTRWLFDDAAAQVASAALIPLVAGEDWQGMLAIGSRDPERFHPGAGTVFLSRIGELISHALHAHLGRLSSTAS